MTPQNAGYAHAAYIVATTVYGVYAFSLWARTRTLARRWRSHSGGSAAMDPPPAPSD